MVSSCLHKGTPLLSDCLSYAGVGFRTKCASVSAGRHQPDARCAAIDHIGSCELRKALEREASSLHFSVAELPWLDVLESVVLKVLEDDAGWVFESDVVASGRGFLP